MLQNKQIKLLLPNYRSIQSRVSPVQPEKESVTHYLAFTDEQRAIIGKYATINRNTAAVKKFKGEFDDRLEESTVGKFKKCYHEELAHVKSTTQEGCDLEVSACLASFNVMYTCI